MIHLLSYLMDYGFSVFTLDLGDLAERRLVVVACPVVHSSYRIFQIMDTDIE